MKESVTLQLDDLHSLSLHVLTHKVEAPLLKVVLELRVHLAGEKGPFSIALFTVGSRTKSTSFQIKTFGRRVGGGFSRHVPQSDVCASRPRILRLRTAFLQEEKPIINQAGYNLR